MKRTLLMTTLLLAACAAPRTTPVAAPTANLLPPAPARAAAPAQVAPQAPPNGGVAPAFSPDGGSIAFLSSTLHTPTDLWVVNRDGSNPRRLTTRGATRFAWSQDGKSIIFTARRKGYAQILSVPVEGGVEEPVAKLPANAALPVYSPDGTLFAFTAPDKERVNGLWIGTADGSRIEQVTEKINVRSYFWNPDSQRIYYEAGKSYGVGIWEMNLKSMQSRNLVNKYIGTPDYHAGSGRFAYPYPTNPGEFEIQILKTDGSEPVNVKAPRLAGRFLLWDANGSGIYYLGQDLEKVPESEKGKKEESADANGHKSAAPPAEYRGVGPVSLWRLDLASKEERRVSPPELHVGAFTLSPDKKSAVLSAVSEKSVSSELFRLDLESGALTPLATSRAASWMAVPSPDSSRLALFTNAGGIDALKVASLGGEEVENHPGVRQQADSRMLWLPESDGIMIYTGGGVFGFTAKGPLTFPEYKELRAYLHADASVQRDEVLVSALPAFGEDPGLYLLKVKENRIEIADLRFPAAPEDTPERGYLQPKWSADGKWIAFTDGVDVWSMGADNKGRKQLTHYAAGNRANSGRIEVASYPVWSVGGKMICFGVKVYEGKEIFRQIRIINSDGSGERTILSEKMDSLFQVFLPEYTNHPFFTAGDEQVIVTEAASGVPNLVAVDVKSGARRRLTEGGALHPALVPEEGVISYTSLEGNVESVWVMNSDGSGKRPFVVKAKESAAAPAAAPKPAAAEAVKPAAKAQQGQGE